MFGKDTEVSAVIRPKVSLAILVTLLGIVSDVSRVSKKACSPIEVTLLGIVIAVRLVMPLNAAKPIVVSEFGRETEERDVAPSNALAPIAVTPLGIFAVPVQDDPSVTTLFATEKLPVVHKYGGEIDTELGASQGPPDGTVPRKLIFVRSVFNWNAPVPIEVKDAGMVIEVNLDDWNA